MLEHGRKPTDRGVLTNWRRQREGLVRTLKESDRPRRTHLLETAERGTCQDTEGLGSRPAEVLTLWRRQREGLVRTRKEINRPRRTHTLEMVEGGTCQDTERNRPKDAHSRTEDGRGRDLSGDGKKPTDRGTLTSWRRQRGELVRTRKETDRPRHTHSLETAEGGTCQDMEKA